MLHSMRWVRVVRWAGGRVCRARTSPWDAPTGPRSSIIRQYASLTCANVAPTVYMLTTTSNRSTFGGT